MTIPLPRVDITHDQGIWIAEILNAYLKNETPNEAKILLKCRGKISTAFDYRQIDERMHYLQEINIFGIYCFDENHELLSSFDKVVRFISNNLDVDNLPRSFIAEELEAALKLPLQHIRISFKLIGHYPLYVDSFSSDNGFGYSSITIEKYDTIQLYIRYKSLTSFIEDMLEYRKPFFDTITTLPSVNYKSYSMPQSIKELMKIFYPVAETTLRRFIKSEENQSNRYILKEKRGKYIYKSTQKGRIKGLLCK